MLMIEHQVYALLLLLLLLMQNEQLFAYEVSLNPAALRDARLVVSIHPVHSFVLHSVLRIFSFFFSVYFSHSTTHEWKRDP